jgi:hypothetical protein
MINGQWAESSFELPGGMLLNEDASDCIPCAGVVLRPLTGDEEEWMARNRGAPNAQAASRLLDSCVLRVDGAEPPPGIARRMLAGDRDYLMLQLRRLTLGDRVRAVLDCPACSSKMDLDFDVAQAPVEGHLQTALWHSLELSGRTLRFRLPAGADQEFVAGRDLTAAAEALFSRCVSFDPGQPLTPEEKAAVIDAMDNTAPQVNIEVDLKCPECGNTFTTPFDMTSFFFDEMRIDSRQLFREIHSLAFYYHWSESEILGMVRERRRLYLSLLSDALRED